MTRDAKPRRGDVAPRQREHGIGQVDGVDRHLRRPAAEENRDSRGARPHVEDVEGPAFFATLRHERQKVVPEARVDLDVVHRVVVAGLFFRVHHLDFEHARNHRSCSCARFAVPQGSDRLGAD